MIKGLQRFTPKWANVLWVLTGLAIVSSILLYSGCGMTSSPNIRTNPTPTPTPAPDTTPPTSAITSPAMGAAVLTGTTVSITGTASDTGGGSVARVEVSVDGGAAYSAATGTTSWSFNWTPTTPGPATIRSRAVDSSGNQQNPPAEITLTVRDAAPPTSAITSPKAGAAVSFRTTVSITGTASDAGGGSVARVEVSVDGGATYSAATGTTAWSYSWTPTTHGRALIKSRAVDDSGNQQNPPVEIKVTVEPTIQSAIDVATDGDTVIVAPGTYVENIDFKGKAITVTSEGGPDVTIIDGGNADSVVKFISGEGRGSTLNGFTVQNGRVGNANSISGGGIRIQSSSPTITNNVIRNNQACRGGGIGILSGSPLIQWNTITANSNHCDFTGGSEDIYINDGGGIHINLEGAPEILDNVISDNETQSGGGIFMGFERTTPIIKRNVIRENRASQGAGISMWDKVDALIAQNLITGNHGEGIHSAAATSAIINNTIADNDSLWEGSGIFMFGYQGLQLINNIIVAKPGQVALRCNGTSPPNARFNNVFSGGAPAYAGSCSGLAGTNGNISADPLFIAPSQGDYHLHQISPSIDAGDNQAPNLQDTDLDGGPRILDGDTNGTATIDMGVYEFLLPPGSTTPISIISFPGQGATVRTGTTISITGLARDAGGGTVARVEVSVDGGATWNPATGTTSWSYNWATGATPGLASIRSRAVDDSENVQDPSAEISITVRTPVTIRVPLAQQTIQSAIDTADYGDTVLVAPGTYREHIDFKGKAITVTSESGRPEDTIIDGGDAYPVVSFISGEGRGSAINGFTLQNGRSAVWGGGVSIQGSSPTITNNVIRNNNACNGAGIGALSGSPLIQRNTITNNIINFCSNRGPFGGGAGIGIEGASFVEILDNVISNNVDGSQQANSGGGIHLFGTGAPIIKRNIIRGNSVNFLGGGISMGLVTDALIVQNLIIGNHAYEGGGIHWIVGEPGARLVNNTIADNDATATGSGLYINGVDVRTELTNNIIVAKPGQVGLYCGGIDPTVRFNNIFSAGGTAYAGGCSNMAGTNGNISADPLFTNPTQGDYHLRQGSPSIDAGYNQAPNLPDTDIDGNPRILDGNGDGTATIDMGIDEFLLPPGLKISILNERDPGSKNSRSLFVCDLRPWARTPDRRPQNPLSALPPLSPRLRVE
jgi:Big-like domain-containing protein/parallel beta helix pectate lyase-like protein